MQKKVDIKQFAMIRLLGKGAYGQVFLARKRDNDKIYAIKALKKKGLEPSKQLQHVKTEKHVMLQARHPFIISLSYTFQNEKCFYFAMEYCPGGDLFSLMSRKHKLREDQAQFFIILIILALEYLHSQKIIYRDLKPENVLIDVKGYIKLGDFGLSKILLEKDQTNSIAGTPEYLAPEVLLKIGHTFSVDCWSLGCLIYEMIVGQPPYIAQQKADLLHQIKNKEPNMEHEMSVEARDLIINLLKKNPEERLTLEQVKKHEWFKDIDDWNAYQEMKKVPPFLPVIQGPEDTSNFDPQFTEQALYSNSPSEGPSPNNRYPDFSGNNSLQ